MNWHVLTQSPILPNPVQPMRSTTLSAPHVYLYRTVPTIQCYPLGTSTYLLLCTSTAPVYSQTRNDYERFRKSKSTCCWLFETDTVGTIRFGLRHRRQSSNSGKLECSL
jgi:hypothetical protein